MDYELGDYYDCEIAYRRAMTLLGAGHRREGFGILLDLEEHVLKTTCPNSYRILFPLVKAALRDREPERQIPARAARQGTLGVYAGRGRIASDQVATLPALLAGNPRAFENHYVVWERETFRAVFEDGLVDDGPRTVLSAATDGGLAEMAGIVSDGDLSTLILLLDPSDFGETDVLCLIRAAIRENVDLRVTFRSAAEFVAHNCGRPSSHLRPQQAHEAVGVVSHPDKKLAMILWVSKNENRLSEFAALYATGHTGGWVEEYRTEAGPSVICMKSGDDGGDEQIARLVVRNRLQHLVFFVDPFWSPPHHVAVLSLLKNCLHRHLSVNLLLNERSASSWIRGFAA